MTKMKRLLSLVLAVAMVMTLLPTIAMAEETQTTVVENQAAASVIAPPADIEWKETDTFPAKAGNWKLTADVTVTETLSGTVNMNLDLNGKTVTVDGVRAFTMSGGGNHTYSVYDSVGTGGFNINMAGGGGLAALGGDGTQVLNIYGGTFNASYTTNGTGTGLIARAGSATSTINIYGGTFIGGTTSGSGSTFYTNNSGKLNVEFKVEGSIGNNVYGDNGIIPATHVACICGSDDANHLPGCDGVKHNKWTVWAEASAQKKVLPKANGYYVLVDNITQSASRSIEANANVYVDLNGYKVTNTATTDRLWNLNASNSTNILTISDSKGGAVIDLGATNAMGALALVNNPTKTLSIYGGTIDASQVTGNGAVVRNAGQTVNVCGGKLIGGTSTEGAVISSSGTVNVSGGEIVCGTSAKGGAIYSTGTVKVTGGDISANTSTIYAASGSTLTIAIEGAGSIGGNHESNNGIYPTTHIACECGAKGADHLPGCAGIKHNNWQAWGDASAERTRVPNANGNWYLVDDVVQNFGESGKSNARDVSSNAVVHVDLNGYTITNAAQETHSIKRLWNVPGSVSNATLTIADSVGGAEIDLGAVNELGTLATIAGTGNTFTLYAGEVNGAAVTHEKGAVIRLATGNTVNIHGGTIIGGTVTALGGAISTSGTLNMTAGEIKNGNASSGGNIAVEAGTFTMSGGSIHDGTVSNMGANVWVDSKATFEKTGGEIYITDSADAGVFPYAKGCACGSNSETHKADCNGAVLNWAAWTSTDSLPITNGNWILTQDVTLTEIQTIIEADANIRLDLNGKTVTLDTTENASIRVYNMISQNSYSLTILDSKGGAVIDLSNSTAAGALALMNNDTKVLNIYGGTIDGSGVEYKSVAGGIIRNVNQTVNIHGGKLIGGENVSGDPASGKGGVIYTGGTMTMTGGEITEGVNYFGGNVYIGAGTFTMTGGKIYDGQAALSGGNVYIAEGATFNLDGGEVYMTNSDDPGIYPPTHEACICGSSTETHLPGCDGTVYEDEWQVWASDAMPTESGKYFLVNDITVTKNVTIAASADIVIDLNGHTITSTAARLWLITNTTEEITGSLSISDSVGTGKIILGTEEKGVSHGSLVQINEAIWTVNVYGGTIDGTYAVSEGGNYGAVIRCRAITGTVNICGGKIIGGTALGGGAIGMDQGKLVISGGEITGGSVSDSGGNVRMAGTSHFVMTGGTISNGEAKYGGNVYIGGEATYDLSAGTITGGAATVDGADVYHGITVYWMVDGIKAGWGHVNSGNVPTCLVGETYESDVAYYTILGWDVNGDGVADEITAVTEETTYTAIFEKTMKQCTVTWIVDGVETTETYDIGAMPEFKGETEWEDEDYTYVITGWDKEIAEVTEDVTYTAKFDATEKIKSYTVTWVVAGGTFTETYAPNDLPEFKGSLVKESDATSYYTFTGWDKTIEKVTGDVTYTAKYKTNALVTFAAAQVVMGNNLDMMFAIRKASFSSWDGMYIEMVHKYADGTPDDVQTVTPDKFGVDGVMYFVTYKGLAAKMMSDDIIVTVYNADGQPVSMPWVDSMRDYAMRRFDQVSGKIDKTLFVDMLNYGAEAQKSLNYNVDDLANALFEQKHLDLVTEGNAYNTGLERGNKHVGSNLILESNISFWIAFKGMNTNMYATVDFVNHLGEEVHMDVAGSQFGNNNGMYYIDVNTLVIADARREITVKVYNADGSLYTECHESIEDYLARKGSAGVSELYAATMKFSDSAYAFLHK